MDSDYSIFTDANPSEETLELLELNYKALVTGILYPNEPNEIRHIYWGLTQVIKQLENAYHEHNESVSVLIELTRSDSGIGIGVVNLSSEDSSSNNS